MKTKKATKPMPKVEKPSLPVKKGSKKGKGSY